MRKSKSFKSLQNMILISFCSSFMGALLVYLALTYLPDLHQQDKADVVGVTADSSETTGLTAESGIEQQSLGQVVNSPSTAGRTSNKAYTDSESNNIEVYEKVNQAVVNITAWKETQVFNWFFEPIPREDEAIGSGSIINADGYILTNNHVVQNASKLLITLYDGSQFKGETVGSDPENDLAIVRFNPRDVAEENGNNTVGKAHRKLSTISFVADGTLQVGQKVFAIGNPYGFERTLTVGIVSGLGRPIQNENGLIIQGMIQTDASINPGNSGGPLLNSQGQMIGVNSSIYSPNGGSVGLGFAVPVSTVKRVLPDLIQYGEVRRGWIDVQVFPLFPQLVRYSKLSVEKGLLVSQVQQGSEADQAGLRGGQRNQAVRSGNQVIYLGGDIITRIDETDVSSMADLYSALEPTHPGQKIKLSVLRDGKKLELTVKLSTRKNKGDGT